MHYTSIPNIMKVLGPLFLDELDMEIDKAWDQERALRQVLDRISKIRVFDPVCGSGNFLVVAYRALREREIRLRIRISQLNGAAQIEMWSLFIRKGLLTYVAEKAGGAAPNGGCPQWPDLPAGPSGGGRDLWPGEPVLGQGRGVPAPVLR